MSELKKLIKICQKGNSTLRYDNKVWRISKLNIGDYAIEFFGEYVTNSKIGDYHKDIQSFTISSTDVVEISHLLFFSNSDKDIRFFDIQKEYSIKLNDKYQAIYSIRDEIDDFRDIIIDKIDEYKIGNFLYNKVDNTILYVNKIFDKSCEIFNLSRGTTSIQSRVVNRDDQLIKNKEYLNNTLKKILTLFRDLINLTIEYNDSNAITHHF
jgi:hypothetical protein